MPGSSSTLAALCFALAVSGCGKSNAPPSVNTAIPPTSAASHPEPAPSASTRAVNKPPHPVDELFRRYQQKLPEPATLSEGNGASLKCPHHGYVTYTLLYATAEKLPVQAADDVPALIPWLRDGDPCVRYIALEALFPKIAFDSNKLSLPNMHDPEHVQYHDIFVALKSFLDKQRIAYDAHAFDGLMLSITREDFSSLKGAWKEAVGAHHNFQYFVDIDAENITVLHKLRRVDPKWPDRPQTSKIKDVNVNGQLQYVVTVVEPADRSYTFWPVSKDVVWFDNGAPGDWRKLTR